MKFLEFKESQLRRVLDDCPSCFYAADNEGHFLWLSRGFTTLTGYTISLVSGQTIASIIMRSRIKKNERNADAIACLIVPEQKAPLKHIRSQVYTLDAQNEGIYAEIAPLDTYEDFSIFSVVHNPHAVESLRLLYYKDYFAILDTEYRFDFLGDRLYCKLARQFGTEKFRGRNIREVLNESDLHEWKRSKTKFIDYAVALEADAVNEWRCVFDSEKEGFKNIFRDLPACWQTEKNALICKDHTKPFKEKYLLSERTFDFFKQDFKVEYALEQGNGGVIFCGSDVWDLSPDESGYMVIISNEKISLKRDSNGLYMLRLDGRKPKRISVTKSGTVITVVADGAEIVKHVDDIPFYGNREHINRFGLFVAGEDVYSSMKVYTRNSLFDYAKLMEYRTLVRFRNEGGRYYEMQMIPGYYHAEFEQKNFLFLRELGEMEKIETRLAEYKKELNKALIRLNTAQEGFHGLIGHSPAMIQIIDTIKTMARMNVSVLVFGETGTGKDLIANAIHIESGRKGPFIKVDCASLPLNLIESELFGYEKGAFTGAHQRKAGRFELADKGTLFLDEIGNLSAELQMKLLRFLQDRQFERLGGKQTLRTDVRVIAATNTDLETEVAAGRFRADLFYRIKVMSIEAPPLRERLMDIYPIVNYITVALAREHGLPVPAFHNSVLPFMLQYDWPGNVRELKNVIEQIMITHGNRIIMPDHFPVHMNRKHVEKLGPSQPDLALSRGKNESYRDKDAFIRAYNTFNGRQSKIAAHFGCSHNTVTYYAKKFGIGELKGDKIRAAVDGFHEKVFTIAQFRNKMNISLPTARAYIDSLLARGVVEKEQRGRFVLFRVCY